MEEIDLLSNKQFFQPDRGFFNGIERVIVNRQVRFFGDKECIYTYNGIQHHHELMPEGIGKVNERLQRYCSHTINSTGVNIYLNGQGMGKHSDSEKDIVEGSTIASVSLGPVAQMIFTNIASKTRK